MNHRPTTHDPAVNTSTGQTPTASRLRASVFVSYSHDDKDEPWYKDVLEYLRQLSLGDQIHLWDDTELAPGADWATEIDRQLNAAKAAVFLISPTFLTSEFIAGEEVPKLLERHEQDGLVVHALVAKPCDWQDHPIASFLESRQLVHSLDSSLEEISGPERRRLLNKLVRQIRSELGVYRFRNSLDRRDQQMQEIESLLNVELGREVAGGNSSVVYKGRRTGVEVAVKALVAAPVSEAAQRELMHEYAQCSTLQHPAFVRIHQLEFHRGFCVATADWVPGQTLSKKIAMSANDAKKDRNAWWHQSTNVLLRIAEAVAEAHDKGSNYVNIDPNKIIMQGWAPRLYTIDLSSYVTRTDHALGLMSFSLSTLEHIAPELIARATGRGDPLAPALGVDADQPINRQLTDQYTLGTLALTLLEGRPPVQLSSLADIRHLLAFHEDPRGFQIDGVRLDERPWQRQFPGLARVIWRMVDPAPEARWASMEVVAAQLRALHRMQEATPAHGTEAKESYLSSVYGNDLFFQRFYARLLEASPEMAAMFQGANMEKQQRVLDNAVERLLNYRPNQKEPTTLTALRSGHRTLGVDAAHFEKFGHIFLATLAEQAGVDRSALDAWEAIIWPGIEYMSAPE